MTKDIKKRFLQFVNENNLVSNNDGIVVGLSGGPDSVCLLHLLCSIREELNIKIAAAHINHMLRGDASESDEEYSKKLCSDLKVEFFSRKIDINKYVEEKGVSSETAGREVRYDYFNEVMKKLSFNKVATAHNANDQAETILLRIMRGTGLEGLGGIPVKRDGVVIRPILFMKREEVEEYCKVNNLNPHIDETNLERIYSRNKVRLDILPYMKDNFNPDIVETINRMGLLLQNDNKYIQTKVLDIYNKYCVKKKNGIVIKKEAFFEDIAIVNRVIRKSLSSISGSHYDVELKHIDIINDLANGGTGKKIDLPNNMYAENVYGDVIINNRNLNVKISMDFIEFNKDEILSKKIDFGNYNIEFNVINSKETIKFTDNEEIKYFDYDKINGNIMIRYRKNGDKIVPLGMKGSKKLKDIFIDMKIPQEERSLIPIIQVDNNIAWVIGVKISDIYKVTKETKNILKIIVKRKDI